MRLPHLHCFLLPCVPIFPCISLAEEEIKTVSDVVEGMEVSVPPKGKADIGYIHGSAK